MSELDNFFSLAVINQIVKGMMSSDSEETHSDAPTSTLDFSADYTNHLSPLALAVCRNNCDIAKLLLDGGADVNALEENGLNPLMIASLLDRRSLVRMLIDYGADVNAKSKSGYTAIMYATLFSSSDCVQILINASADLNVPRLKKPEHDKRNFHDVLDSYIAEYSKNSGLKISDIYKGTKIYEGVYALSKQTFSKIRSNKNSNYRPKKNSVLILAIGLRLTVEESEELLLSAGYHFDPQNKFDMVVKSFIERRNFNMGEIEEALFKETGRTFCKYEEST